jgi:UDP-N-acetylmuramoyl-tripeptide--D-alanyl-D-alanine ligase
MDLCDVVPGCLFVAEVEGGTSGGLDDVWAAVSVGAVAVLTPCPVGVPAIVVADVTVALGRLAGEIVNRLSGTLVIGVTGSCGKTSTKDIAAHLLRQAGVTVATLESNNHFTGVPLTVSRAETDTRFLLLEMGTSHPGDLRYLTSVARPKVGVVLNVGTAHLGGFGDQAAIAEGKCELVEALPSDGVAILNADDHRVRAMAHRTRAQVVFVGHSPDVEVRADQVQLNDHGRARFVLEVPEGRVQIRLQQVGGHHVSNALAAAAVARHVGLQLDRIADGLNTAEVTSRWRMAISERPDGVTVVNDACNANPDSMRASLVALAEMAGSRRTVTVLGPMLDLGDHEEHEHQRLGAFLATLGIDVLVTVGATPAAWIGREARRHRVHTVAAATQAEALTLIQAILKPGDLVLLKASRDARLELLAARLVNEKWEQGHVPTLRP